MSFTPHPKGTFTRCVAPNGLVMLTGCEHHIFELVSDPQPSNFGCGWVQAARCVIDGESTLLVDADWFHVKITSFDIADCLGWIQGTIAALQDAHADIERIALGAPIQTQTLRNFE